MVGVGVFFFLVLGLGLSSIVMVYCCCGVIMVFSFFKIKDHFLLLLMFLELMMLSSSGALGVLVGQSVGGFSFIFSFFCCSVCEACVGVSILIKASRAIGSEKLKGV